MSEIQDKLISISDAYQAGVKDGKASIGKILKIRSAGFRWKMQAVFLEDSEKLCECGNKQVARDFHEMMFARVLLPANDLYIADLWGIKVNRGEIQL